MSTAKLLKPHFSHILAYQVHTLISLNGPGIRIGMK